MIEITWDYIHGKLQFEWPSWKLLEAKKLTQIQQINELDKYVGEKVVDPVAFLVT